MMELWKQYVHETVKRYKGKIDYWEVLNEPYNAVFGDWSPQEYMQILEITEAAIRKANPDAKVVAPCTYLSPKWCPPMLEAGLLEHLDVFSYHGYSMESSALDTMQKWSTYDGKDRPCFDTENGCHGASKFFCKSYAGREYSAGREPLEAAARMSQAILRARAHGTDVVFQYWMRRMRRTRVMAASSTATARPRRARWPLVSQAGCCGATRSAPCCVWAHTWTAPVRGSQGW